QQARDAYSFFSGQIGTGTNRQEVNAENQSTGAASTRRIDVAPIMGGTAKKRATVMQDMLKTFKAFVRYGSPGSKKAIGVYKTINSS
ncbi:hypothetical protein, partial [Caballeronia sp. GAOx1]|uniref:hypothetical protein n=1 Tax=Caballeronia sp. GAOx1 TaxID=2921761 RepID=UPI002028EE05